MNQYLMLVLIAGLLWSALPVTAATCGNQNCETGENSCTCAQDCGSCDSFSTELSVYVCVEDVCTQRPRTGVCGNEICETAYNESFGTCAVDCAPTTLDFEIVSPDLNQFFSRDQNVPFEVKITSEGREIRGAFVRLRGPFQTVELYNSTFDNRYLGAFRVYADAALGIRPVFLEGVYRGLVINQTYEIDVQNRLRGEVTVASQVLLGENISVNALIKNGTVPVALDLNLRIIDSTSQTLHSQVITTDENGPGRASFKTSLNDPEGTWMVLLHGTDAVGNIFDYNQNVELVHPSRQRALDIELILEETQVALGNNLSIIARILDRNQIVSNATLELLTPLQESVLFPEPIDGNYSLLYRVPPSLGLGEKTFVLRATQSGTTNVRGQTQFVITLVANEFSIEQVDPKERFFSVGDTIPFRFLMKYNSNDPVLDANAFVYFNDLRVPLTAVGGGYYTAIYVVEEGDTGELFMRINANDAFGQVSNFENKLDIYGFSPQYYAAVYGPAVAVGLAVAAILFVVINHVYLRKRKLETAQKRMGELEELEKGLQTRYFEQGALSRTQFEAQMQSYEDERKKIEKMLSEHKK